MATNRKRSTSTQAANRGKQRSTTNQAKSDVRQTASDVTNTVTSTVKGGSKTFKEFATKFTKDWTPHLAQALTFSLVTSTIPLATLLLAIVGQIIGGMSTNARTQFINQMEKILPASVFSSQQSQAIAQSAIQRLAQGAGIWLIVSIIAALFFGSRLFTLLEACFDMIYRVPPRPFKQKNVLAIVMVLVFMVLTPLLVLASLIPGELVALIQNTPIGPGSSSLVNKITGIVSSLLVSFLLFEVIYVFLPNRQGNIEGRARSSLPGAVTAAVVLQIALVLFPLYARTATNGVVSQIAFVLVLLIFFYLIALVTLIGATVNAYFAENIRPTEHDLVTRSSKSN